VTLDLTVADLQGKAVEAEMAVAVVDESVLALTGFKTPTLERLTRFDLLYRSSRVSSVRISFTRLPSIPQILSPHGRRRHVRGDALQAPQTLPGGSLL